MNNIETIIKTHNSSIINKENNKTPDTCNCRKKEECPLPGKCTIQNVIYEAKVTTENDEKRYIGLTATPFKTRYSSHKSSFNNRDKSNQTELSKHIWKLKDEGHPVQHNLDNKKTRSTIFTRIEKMQPLSVGEVLYHHSRQKEHLKFKIRTRLNLQT